MSTDRHGWAELTVHRKEILEKLEKSLKGKKFKDIEVQDRRIDKKRAGT
jgi:hypothetical protein